MDEVQYAAARIYAPRLESHFARELNGARSGSGRIRAWRDSIVRPVAYAVRPPFTELADLMNGAREERQLGVGRVVDAVAGLTAVDGATVIADRYELLAFGVTIGRPDGRLRVERVAFSEPIEGDVGCRRPALGIEPRTC